MWFNGEGFWAETALFWWNILVFWQHFSLSLSPLPSLAPLIGSVSLLRVVIYGWIVSCMRQYPGHSLHALHQGYGYWMGKHTLCVSMCVCDKVSTHILKLCVSMCTCACVCAFVCVCVCVCVCLCMCVCVCIPKYTYLLRLWVFYSIDIAEYVCVDAARRHNVWYCCTDTMWNSGMKMGFREKNVLLEKHTPWI